MRGVVGFDLDPRHRTIRRADFLEDDLPELAGATVIGNPPYGRHHSLSRAFVKRAFDQGARRVAFLLPLGFMRSSILTLGNRVEYFKGIEAFEFHDTHEGKLAAPAPKMAWVVLTSEPIQKSTQYFERCEAWEGDSFWLQGKEYGSECKPEPYLHGFAAGRFTGTRSDGKRVNGTAYRKLIDPQGDRGVLEMISTESGNRIQPTAEAANFLLSNPEIYRGEIVL